MEPGCVRQWFAAAHLDGYVVAQRRYVSGCRTRRGPGADDPELTDTARGRLRDAHALLSHTRYDGSIYLAGYAVEMALKVRIAKTLKWQAFPDTNSEFKGLLSLKTHDLNVLLSFTGRESKIRGSHGTEWSVVVAWKPELRYKPIGSATQASAALMLHSAKQITRALL